MSVKQDVIEPIPARAGLGLKPQHFEAILEQQPDIGWFEIHPENYMVDGGAAHHYLSRIRANYPLSMHGVGLSLGSVEGVCDTHLQRLKSLIERYEPGLVSEHLTWNRSEGISLNDLLPTPFNERAIQVFVDNIDKTQNLLQRQILIENPSSYLSVAESDYTEYEFFIEVVKRAGARMLLDVNNIYVSASNLTESEQAFTPDEYLNAIPAEYVGEIHLAGHTLKTFDEFDIRIDDHGSEVCEAVWDLYARTLEKIGPVPTLIERDNNIPALPELMIEVDRAECLLVPAPLDTQASTGRAYA